MSNQQKKWEYRYDEDLIKILLNGDCPHCTTITLIESDKGVTAVELPTPLNIVHKGFRHCSHCDYTIIGNPYFVAYKIVPLIEEVEQETNYNVCPNPECTGNRADNDIIWDPDHFETVCRRCGWVLDGTPHTMYNREGLSIWIDYPHRGSIQLLIEKGDIRMPNKNEGKQVFYSRRGRI